MDHWKYIVPCGIADKPITSLKLLLGIAPPMNEVMERFEACFRILFPDSN
jgi:lipoate-protein ligase B